jgi:hypothetical protein
MPKHDNKTTNKQDPGAKLLKEQFSDLSTSRSAWRSTGAALYKESKQRVPPEQAKDHTRAKNENVSAEGRIARFLERLERVITREATKSSRDSGYDRLQQRLLTAAVIDTTDANLVEKIARGLFQSEKRAALERGHGQQAQGADFDQVKDDYIKLVDEKRSVQLRSLPTWTDYLAKNDAHYPSWFRYLAIRSVLKMGEFDRDTPKFGKRSKDTIAAFPELNSEALGFVYKALSDPASIAPKNEALLVPFRAALTSKSFAGLYAVALVECNQTIDRSRLEGEWRKYDKGSNYKILEKDLASKGTGWCTASGAAQAHIQGGDFYVYYTKDDQGLCSVPRVAIRMVNNKIAEIRGIGARQELEPEFVAVVEEKGSTLRGYENFKKASADMKLLTAIDQRCCRRDAEGKLVEHLTPDPPLTIEELGFLYEVDSKISSFGYARDPRIDLIKGARPNLKADYATMYGVDISQVAIAKGEITEDTRLYVGGLGRSDYRILQDRREPLIICGAVDFRGTPINSIPQGVVFNDSAIFEGCTSLTSIPQGLVFNKKASFSGCTSLTSIPQGAVFNDSAIFEGCTSLTSIPQGVVFYGQADFRECTALTSISEGVVFNGQADFRECTALTSISEGVVFKGDAHFYGCSALTSILQGVVFYGQADFRECTALTSISEGVVFNGQADFRECTALTSISEGVVFKGYAHFYGCSALTSILQGVVFYGQADFSECTALTSISEGVVFNGGAYFGGCSALTSILQGVVFNGDAHFYGCSALKSIPQGVVFNGGAYFGGCSALTSILQGVVFYGQADFRECTALTSIPEGVVFNGEASFRGCTALTSIPRNTIFKGPADFTDCTALIDIGEGTEFHGWYNFNRCRSLRSDPIAEIRGIGARQELESEFVHIVEEEGSTLPGYEKFKKASADMKMLTAIDQRCCRRDAEGKIAEHLTPEPPLTGEELRFLYEVDSKISSFRYDRDPRIDEIKRARPNVKEDYATMYGVDSSQVAIEKGEITDATRVYAGGLKPDDYRILQDRSGPLIIFGAVDFRGTPINSIPQGVVFNQGALFGGCTYLTSIPQGAVFKGDTYFDGCTALTSIPQGVVFNGDAIFYGCTSLTSIPQGVVFNGGANFASCTYLTSIPQGVVFNGIASFRDCTSLTSIPRNTIFKAKADFNGCTALVEIGEGTEFHGQYDFENCPALRSDPKVFDGRRVT